MLGKVLDQRLVALFKCVSCIASACFCCCCFNLIFNGWFYPEMLGQHCLATWSRTGLYCLVTAHMCEVKSVSRTGLYCLVTAHTCEVKSVSQTGLYCLVTAYMCEVESVSQTGLCCLVTAHIMREVKPVSRAGLYCLVTAHAKPGNGGSHSKTCRT